MEEQFDVLGTLSSPFIIKPASCMKSPKSNSKLGNISFNSPSKKAFLVEFNKENECENFVVSNTHSSKDVTSETTQNVNNDCCTLDEAELLDMDNLNLDNSNSWLLDTRSKCEDNFDVFNWLKRDVDVDDCKVGRRFSCPKSPASLRTFSSESSGTNTSSIASQLESLRMHAKLPGRGCRRSSDSPLPTPPASLHLSPPPLLTISPIPSAQKKKPKGTPAFGESESQFGSKSAKLPEKEIARDLPDAGLSLDAARSSFDAFDSEGGAQVGHSTVQMTSFMNKSLDDVLSLDRPTGESPMQKSFSRSQETCFSPGGMVAVMIEEGPKLSRAAGGSMNKLTNVEDVENLARLQADHLRQTLRSSFSSKRLSQSTDRLRHTPGYSLAPDVGQIRIPGTSDSDDNLASKCRGPVEIRKRADLANTTHPVALSNIIPRTRMPQAHSKLPPPLSIQQPKELRASPKGATKISAPSSSLLQCTTKSRNSSMTRVPAAKIQDKFGIAASNRSLESQSPARQLVKASAPRPLSRPPSSLRMKAEKTLDGDRSTEHVESARANQEEVQQRPASKTRSGSSLSNPAAEGPANPDGTSAIKPALTSSIPVSRGIPRVSSIPRPKLKQVAK